MQKIKAYLLALYIAEYIIKSFYPVKLLEYIMMFTVICILLSFFSKATPLNKILSLIVGSLGTFLLLKSNAPLICFGEALIENAGLISLLASVPLLGITFFYDDFQKYVIELTQKYLTSNLSFYIITICVINLFGMLLNIASLPLVHQLLKKTSSKFSKEVFYKALTRGFTTNLLWSPSFVSVAIVINYLNISWKEIAPTGFILAFLGNILGILLEKRGAKEKEKEVSVEVKKDSEKAKKVFKLVMLILFIISTIVFLEHLIDKSVLVILPIVSVFVPLSLAFIFSKFDIFKKGFKKYFNVSLPGMSNEVVLFTAIGYFGYSLKYSQAGKVIPMIIESLGFDSTFTLIPLFILLITGLSILGVHPIISISTIAITMPVGELPLTVIQMAVVFLVSYSLYQTLSPFAATTIIMSNINEENPFYVSIRLNYLYGLLLIVLTTLYLHLI